MIHSRNFEQLFNPFHHGYIHGNSQQLLQQSSTSATSASHPHHRFSAFQPVQLKQSPRSSPTSTVLSIMPTITPITQPSNVNDSALAAAAHLETIVSNMGTSKQGHLCIYCGKLYSRKYGEHETNKKATKTFVCCQIEIIDCNFLVLLSSRLFLFRSENSHSNAHRYGFF